MSANATQSELRLSRLVDERDMTQQLHENLLAAVETREDKLLSEAESQQVTMYRERAVELDTEINSLVGTIEQHNKAVEESKKIRRVLAGANDVEVDGEGVIYRTMAAYARDVILTGTGREAGKISASLGSPNEIQAARERLQLLKRVNNTLSSNVEGLIPDQHIAQIFQVIDNSRPIVASANRTALNRGTLAYPSVTTRPVVAAQGTEKTLAGDTGMVIDMLTTSATTYLGGGDLSWQAINWSTPDALETWFRLVAADYALKTEQDAAQVLQHSAFTYDITTTLSPTPTFAEFMTAIGAGYAAAFANSGRTANTIYMAPDRFGYLLGLTSDAFTQFTAVTGSNVGPLNVIVSRGMDAGVIVVGDREGLLVAETPGAPVELRVVEPAIGGVEVGLIGAFEAVVTDPGAFALITAAS